MKRSGQNPDRVQIPAWRVDGYGPLLELYLAEFYGNPLDDVDPVPALVPRFFAIEWLRLT